MYHIVYVDDEPALLECGKIFLERGNEFVVDTITSATEALALLQNTDYDAIISDYQMPAMDGIEFLKRVRASGNKIPFILFTGRGREEIVIQALNAGADFYLQKGGELKSQFAELSNKIEYAIRKRNAEKALVESEKKFRIVVENTHDGIMILKPGGEILFSNRAADVVFDEPDTVQPDRTKNLLDFIDPDDRSKAKDDIAGVARGSESPRMNYQAVTANGRKIWIKCTAKPIVFKESSAIIVSVREITSRKRMEQEIEQAKRLNLLSGITRHDINNQLQAITSYVGLLHEKVQDPSCEDYFSRIMELTHQINVMIAFNKDYEQINGRSVTWQGIRNLVENQYKDCAPKQVIVINDLPGDIEIYADPLIVTVFFNMIDNAIRHGGRVTTIRFFFTVREHEAVIFCEDDGIGVDYAIKEKIFDRDFGKHTGLGLAISREILALTGITIRENGIPGTGARFEIVVPDKACRTTAPAMKVLE